MQTSNSANIRVRNIFAQKNTSELIKYAEVTGQELAQASLTTSQLRNILDSIQVLRKYDPDKLQLLRAKLAYAAGKNSKVGPFRKILEEAIECVKDDETFAFFRNFVEAIVAYHTLAESKKKQLEPTGGQERRKE